MSDKQAALTTYLEQLDKTDKITIYLDDVEINRRKLRADATSIYEETIARCEDPDPALEERIKSVEEKINALVNCNNDRLNIVEERIDEIAIPTIERLDSVEKSIAAISEQIESDVSDNLRRFESVFITPILNRLDDSEKALRVISEQIDWDKQRETVVLDREEYERIIKRLKIEAEGGNQIAGFVSDWLKDAQHI